MSNIRKLRNNILNINAWRVLGTPVFLRLLWGAMVCAPRIAKTGNLQDLDRYMAKFSKTFSTKIGPVTFECDYNDAMFFDGTFSFGLIREIYIRNCYLRFFPPDFLSSITNAVDLGANRGVMSALLASKCSKLVSVEANPALRDVLAYNIQSNSNHLNNQVITGFVGCDVGFQISGAREVVEMSTILDFFGKDYVDLIKIDIEGSEYGLFDAPQWLDRVKSITIEVHRNHGDNNLIVDTLLSKGFNVLVADEDLAILNDVNDADFIYGIREFDFVDASNE